MASICLSATHTGTAASASKQNPLPGTGKPGDGRKSEAEDHSEVSGNRRGKILVCFIEKAACDLPGWLPERAINSTG